jgi:putative colanic acid biosynthesis acetyltransferase WcaB
MENTDSVIKWVFQDWSVNDQRPEYRILLVWFRLAQWAFRRWGILGKLMISVPYTLLTSQLLSMELPFRAEVGPRLRLYHKHALVIHPDATIGNDCHLRQGITIGNKVDRDGKSIGVASIGNSVDLGVGCVVIGDIHVGDYARIGANAVVTKSVPAYAVVVGNPGRVIRLDAPNSSTETSSTTP